MGSSKRRKTTISHFLWGFPIAIFLYRNNSKTAGPISVIHLSLFSKFKALLYESILSYPCSSPLTLFRPGFFYRLKVPLMISGTIAASPMKLCTVIVLLKTYQNTKRNFQKYDLWRHNYVITKNNGKIRTSVKPGKLHIIRKVMMRALRKWNFYWNWVTESKVMAI